MSKETLSDLVISAPNENDVSLKYFLVTVYDFFPFICASGNTEGRSRNSGARTGSRFLVDPNVHRRLLRSSPPLVSILINEVLFNIVFPFKRWSFRLPFSLCLPTSLITYPCHLPRPSRPLIQRTFIQSPNRCSSMC